MTDDDAMRLMLIEMSDNIKPIREFLMGEVTYFERQGFTVEQSRALAAAEFTSIFGVRIRQSATDPPSSS